MPYIKQEKRSALDPSIETLLDTLRGLQCDDPDGDNLEGNLNYVFSTILNRLYTSGYGDVNTAMGLLGSVQSEYYRRVGSRIEEQKRFDNGDVYTDEL